MATYKVLQDIEAEDKLLGPLTLKQFIFAVITIGIGFIQFKLITATALSVVRWPFVIVLLLPMVVFGFLAAPISSDQPNDVWLLARLRFIVKPHTRIWNQDGISNLVTITVPKKVEEILTNGLNQDEVKSRLNALANTLDSRGWAVKNVNTNLYAQPNYIDGSSDRLVDPSTLPQDVPIADVTTADDILDTANNPTAHQLDQMVQASAQAHRQQVVNQMKAPDQAQTPTDYWFMNAPAQPPADIQPDYTTFEKQEVVAPGTAISNAPEPVITADDTALLEKIRHDKEVSQPVYGNLRTLQPVHDKDGNLIARPQSPVPEEPVSAEISPPETAKPETTTPNPAILGLAQNNDRSVASIAREAEKLNGDDEVVISLH